MYAKPIMRQAIADNGRYLRGTAMLVSVMMWEYVKEMGARVLVLGRAEEVVCSYEKVKDTDLAL
eukprot:scaffold149480_cov20-Cyclotella_meneghiniana.AAC.1